MKGKSAPQDKGGASQVYRLKVTLVGIKPPIWRRILVPGGTTLEGLHYAIQAAMGWTNSHLHQFELGETTYSDRRFELGDVEDERKARLGAIGLKKGKAFRYIYDFGDNWEHQVKVEDVLAPDEKLRYPTCVDGKRAGPPEDCGGIWGYDELLRAISDPKHPDHEEMLEWAGGSFDPEAFDLEAVNRQMRR